ncbi:MAG: hypothetical protein IPK64_18905 [bacterium]|nr:hypothetical protein [bacterium]
MRKLNVNKDTLRVLDEANLDRVQGGVGVSPDQVDDKDPLLTTWPSRCHLCASDVCSIAYRCGFIR